MKIAIFTDNFLPGVGGTENAVLNFAEILAKENDVIIFAPDYHKKFNDFALFVKVVRIQSVAVTKNDCAAIPSFDKNPKKILKDFNPDIIHTKTLGPVASFGAKFAKKNNIPLISTVHTKYRFCYRRSVHLKGIAEIIVRRFAKTLKYADSVCTISKDMKAEIKSYGIDKKIAVIKNGGIKRNNVFEKKENKKFTCLFVGLVVKYKNLKFSLDALKKVKEKGYDFIFNIVGDGQDRKYFEKYVKKIGLTENVKFFGRIIDKKKLDKIYANADLFLLPSVFDNDPLVVCEAGNMGTPSLVIKNTGSSERIINNQNGFIEKNNLDAYAKRIIFLMNNKSLLKGAGEKAKNLFTSWEDNVKEYLKIYNTILNKRGK